MLLTNGSSCEVPFTAAVSPFKGVPDPFSPFSCAVALACEVRRDIMRDLSGLYGEARVPSSSAVCRSGRFRLPLAGAIVGGA